MKQPRKGNRDLIRKINRNLVLTLIKNQGPVSRTDLARVSNLSTASVSNITSQLIEDGLVHEMGEGVSSGGRRPVLLRLNYKAGYVVGVKLMEWGVTCALTDLDAQVQQQHVAYFPADLQPTTPQVLIPTMVQAVEETIAQSGIDSERVLGVGIGMAGAVNGKLGICHYSPFFEWRDAPLAQLMSDTLKLPVYLENDVNTLTIAEKWFGHGHETAHFIVATIGRGIGAGFVMNGQFYRGAMGGAGEFGHVALMVNGEMRTLEDLASDSAVIQQLSLALQNNTPTSLSTIDKPIEIDDVISAADHGDLLAQQLLAQSGHWFGVGLSTLINLLNPELLIVGGEGVAAGSWRFDAMHAAIQTHTFDGLGEDLRIMVELSGDETWARGAACVVLSELFKSPVYHDESASAVAPL